MNFKPPDSALIGWGPELGFARWMSRYTAGNPKEDLPAMLSIYLGIQPTIYLSSYLAFYLTMLLLLPLYYYHPSLFNYLLPLSSY